MNVMPLQTKRIDTVPVAGNDVALPPAGPGFVSCPEIFGMHAAVHTLVEQLEQVEQVAQNTTKGIVMPARDALWHEAPRVVCP